ncbi:YwpF-like family protein [Anoxybacteroides tepidamans]|uniref:YwpF-like family protein n=1 Tax=Anoxybacteroides tepidamans TaxID=265948 RepID=UPI0004800905|nr:YwpF-like family protein [Anoxybacillus tepidamans]
MKTFKLVGLQVIRDERNRQEIPLIDGLVINKEDEKRRWLVEAYIDKQHEPLFAELQNNHHEIRLQVTISNINNDPANMVATVRSITLMNEHISVLMEGMLLRNRTDLAEVVLAGLVEKGLQGEALLKEFKHELYERRGAEEREPVKANHTTKG